MSTTVKTPHINPRLMAAVRDEAENSARLSRHEHAEIDFVGIHGIVDRRIAHDQWKRIMESRPTRQR